MRPSPGRAAAQIKSIIHDADLDVRRPVYGPSYLDSIVGDIHPDGLIANDIRYSIRTLRELADALEARLPKKQEGTA